MLKWLSFSWLFFLSLVSCAYSQPLSPATNDSQTTHTQQRVNNAVKLVRTRGKIAAVCTFNSSSNHAFRYSGQYVFAFVCNDGDNDGFFVSDPSTPQYTFQQRRHNQLVAHMLAAVNHHPNGVWLNYCWYDPTTKHFEQKRSYIRMIKEQKLCIGSSYSIKNQPCPHGTSSLN